MTLTELADRLNVTTFDLTAIITSDQTEDAGSYFENYDPANPTPDPQLSEAGIASLTRHVADLLGTIDRVTFRALLGVWMTNDPDGTYPFIDHEAFTAYLDLVASDYGFDDAVDAYHHLAPVTRIVDLTETGASLKMLREALCVAQTDLHHRLDGRTNAMHRLQDILNLIDRHRPLDADGRHGNLHTPSCGCEDKTNG